jgi:hypothetical protein
MPWRPPPAQPPRGPARWPIVVMFAITLVAVGAAIAAWLRPLPEKSTAPQTPTFNEQQIADAKARVCGAYEKVKKASNMNASRNGGDDPNAQLLVAVNGRQVYIASSQYLLTTLDEIPATSADLAASARKLANLFQTIAIDGLASDPSPAAHNDVSETGIRLESLCK